jgi:hypothetical protein
MKRISHLVVVTALAFSAQAAWSDESIETAAAEGSTESAETYLNVAALGSSAERQADVAAAPKARKSESMLEKLGLAGHDGFPARGGPIDD